MEPPGFNISGTNFKLVALKLCKMPETGFKWQLVKSKKEAKQNKKVSGTWFCCVLAKWT